VLVVKAQSWAYRKNISMIALATIRAVMLVLGLVTWVGQPVNPAQAQSPDDSANITSPPATNESVRVIVALRAPETGVSVGLQIQSVAQTQREVLAALPPEEFQLIQQYEVLPGLVGEVTAQGLDTLLNQPEVEAVSLDLPVEAALTESVALLGADRVWRELGFTGAGVNVAVLDTGIDTDHPDLADNLIAQKCFGQGICLPDNADESDSAEDGNGHGTHVAGIITGRGENSPRGVAPDTGIVAVRVIGDNGSGFTSDVISGIDWVIANQAQLNVKVINLSLGGGAYREVCDTADANTRLYAEAVRTARQAGITIFAASGNSGLTERMMAPACVSGVISVGSTYDANLGDVTLGGCRDEHATVDQVACISNSSPVLDLLAPGAVIDSTALGGGQKAEAGTSMSTAHATAVAALVLQANSDLTPAEIETVLKETGVPVTDGRNGRVTPRLDALAAVSRVSGSNPTAISGTVLLEGRADHSGTQIFLSEAPCSTAVFSTSTTTTGSGGDFEITPLPARQNQQCLQVVHQGYLVGQHSAPLGDLGVIILPGGDLIEDGLIDIFDVIYVAVRYDSDDPTADLTADGLVDIFDLVVVAGNYGQQGPLTDWR
jgi:subtilisin family serine protease